MPDHRIQLLFWIMYLNVQFKVKACPMACLCSSEPKITVNCQQQKLTEIPSEIPIQSQRIFLHNNKIIQVKDKSLSLCHNMTILRIHSNNISLIESLAFYGLHKLEELDIGDNINLKSINPITFQGLTRLHTLHINRCGLLELPKGIFQGLFSLQFLYIQNNNLQSLHDDTFLDLANLTYLFLHDNKIKSLSENVFRGLISLDRLLLHQNRVNQIHSQAFHDLGKVMTLYLFNNNLTELQGDCLTPLINLQYLRLNGNEWICDCRAWSLWNWFKQFKGSSSEVKCLSPAHLLGKDLKALQKTEFEGCLDAFNQMKTRHFSSKNRSGKLSTPDTPLKSKDELKKCCQVNIDKSYIYESKHMPGVASHSSRLSPNNPLKEKESMSKIKSLENHSPIKNGTHKQINDSPFGTFSRNAEHSMSTLQPEWTELNESSTFPSRRKQGCLKKAKSKFQCHFNNQGTSSSVPLKVHYFGLFLVWFGFIC
uniref:Reticulon-4 receptor n=1 Tax=Geotrypetes seraphini TaxID=260995 RepID=A0A6P8S6L9_GEOSA|nr:reticulon-4 receptor [Geotrypetes seraphini]XP_033812648.1 reticulon-4 receptor [Geotrypetes seraphini]